MLKIGEFSRLSQVTVATLHHYDEIGLLKPAQIDSFTSYRYYNVEQLARLHRIMALKELGLSLEQIALMMSDELSSEQIRGMLRLQQAQIQQRVREDQVRLAQVEFHLRMIEMEDKMPELDVIVKQIPPVRAMTLRRTMKNEDLVAFGIELEQALVRHDIKLVAPAFEIHYAEEFNVDFEDVEYVIPIGDLPIDKMPLETFGVFTLTTVPGLEMAATHIHHGHDGLLISDVMPVLQRWIVDNGYKLCGTHRMVHHRGPLEHAEYKDWLREFQHEITVAE
jgi:DNA-binding transcriptional MerR regulator